GRSAEGSLPVLLSRSLGALTVEVETAAGVGSDVPSLAVWSNVLRCVAGGNGGLDERDLPGAARISSRLATAAVTGCARRGWLVVSPAPDGGKARRLELTEVGRAAARDWPAQLGALDARWAGTPLRAGLEGIVSQLPLELPHFPAPYGAADPSAIGGPYMQGAKRTEGIPAHGKDWRPVPRTDGDTVTALPVTALLSQALMAFTIDYEDLFPWPLESTLNVLCHIGPQPAPLANVPGDHGITGVGKSLLERHLIAVVTRAEDDPGQKLVALTDRGQLVMEHHPRRLEAVEAEWRDRFGAALTALRNALAPLAASAPSSAPDHPMAALHLG
ncbi:MAG TPA: hypothetical protein VM030_02440, partial [Acidimicrobiales bacterium]|nr:hypothetical protein [Acidimicrobiales bacterium]